MHRYFKIAALAVAVLIFAGCGRPLRAPEFRRSEGLAAGTQGGAWEVVLPGPAFAAVEPGAEASRRNAALSHRPDEAVMAIDSWPRRERPDLARWRTLRLPRDAGAVIYFDQTRRPHFHGRGEHGRGVAPYDRYRPGEHW